MLEEDNAGGTVETPTIEELQARLAKAEGKIVEMKKSSKETTPEVKAPAETNDTFMTRAEFEQEQFFLSNPNLVEHKDSIKELVSKGYSLEDAKVVTLNKDKTIKARENTQKTNFTSGEPANIHQTSYTHDELEKLSQSDYNKVMSLKEQGKVNIT